jgi:hypothetical protein
MFFHLQYIHLFRPFLKYSPASSPLPSHVSPRRICTANAGAISKLMRLYKKAYNLRQICNIAGMFGVMAAQLWRRATYSYLFLF